MATVLLTTATFCGTLAAARDLGQRGYRVWMAGPGTARYSRFVERRLSCPDLRDPGAFIAWLLALGREHPGLVLYPTSDDMAWLFAVHHEALARVFRVWAPPVAVYERVLDKMTLHDACREVGLEAPATVSPSDAELEHVVEHLPLPTLIKQRTQILSTNHKGVVVHERAEVAAAFRRFRAANPHHLPEGRLGEAADPMLQQYFAEGTNGSLQVSGFIDDTGELFVARAAKKVLQRPKKLGISLCLEATELEPQLAARVRALCRRVGYFGVFSCEFLQVDGRPLLIDFNPRYYHFLAFDHARGLPQAWLSVLAALGERDELARQVALAQVDRPGVETFTYRLQLAELVALQTLTRTMPLREAGHWLRWYQRHREALVDAVDQAGDRLPTLMDVAHAVHQRVRHPLSSFRHVALDRA
ncbi:MAG: carbamoyl-phosphate synthase [Myxococcota bacterium]